MKKIFCIVSALALFAASAFAQEEKSFDDFGFTLKEGDKVESNLRVVFPMYFGGTILLNNQFKGDWASLDGSNFLDVNPLKSFNYQLEIASLRIASNNSPFMMSVGVRWNFIDLALKDKDLTFRNSGSGNYLPTSISSTNSTYDGSKSKLHASYLGIPLRVYYNAGKGKLYAGVSADYLLTGYTKYKNPKYRETARDMFNDFRASAEAGFCYGIIGVYVNYGITNLFPAELSGANTLSFGLTLGM